MSNGIDFRELRNRLSSDDIINILKKYEVYPFMETDVYIIYPTVCHNLTGGSKKLYYYKNSHLFKCYTQCEGMFDIFELLVKINKLRGKTITIFDAIKECNLNYYEIAENKPINIVEDINYLYNLLHTKNELAQLPHLDDTLLSRYIFDRDVLQIWVNEGISFETMLKYGICYDVIENCITIPNYDDQDNLISIRGRFLSEDAEAKYKPITFGGKLLSHPSSLALYGLNINKEAIQRQHKAVIFESEKSVMMMDTQYGDNNISVATLGKNVSIQQIKLLLKYDVREIILAYDADYRTYDEMNKKRDEYMRIARTLTTYFTTSIILDLDMNLLHYKDSPIDRGKEVFEKLLENRIYIC